MSFFKKITLIIALLVFAVGILGASIWQTAAQTTDEGSVLLIEGDETASSVPGQVTEEINKVDYDLHWGGTLYPGILPDHLLYPLKMIRDRIWLFLTTDPLKIAPFGYFYHSFHFKFCAVFFTLCTRYKPENSPRTSAKPHKPIDSFLLSHFITIESFYLEICAPSLHVVLVHCFVWLLC